MHPELVVSVPSSLYHQVFLIPDSIIFFATSIIFHLSSIFNPLTFFIEPSASDFLLLATKWHGFFPRVA
jgi:hypothetical protein